MTTVVITWRRGNNHSICSQLQSLNFECYTQGLIFICGQVSRWQFMALLHKCCCLFLSMWLRYEPSFISSRTCCLHWHCDRLISLSYQAGQASKHFLLFLYQSHADSNSNYWECSGPLSQENPEQIACMGWKHYFKVWMAILRGQHLPVEIKGE